MVLQCYVNVSWIVCDLNKQKSNMDISDIMLLNKTDG